MATATTSKSENPKKTLAQTQSSNPDESAPVEDLTPINPSSSPSTAQESSGGLGEKNTDGADGGGPVTDTQKKMRRAERFGMPVQLSEQEKRDSRAERFGMGPGLHGSEAVKKSEELKRKARAERFGIAPTTSSDDDAKKKARLARFAPASKPDLVEEDKRKARAIRFSQKQSTSLEKENGKGNMETKPTVLGKAGGGL